MKVLALADESTLNRQRKYLRWPTQVLSFFRADLLRKSHTRHCPNKTRKEQPAQEKNKIQNRHIDFCTKKCAFTKNYVSSLTEKVNHL